MILTKSNPRCTDAELTTATRQCKCCGETKTADLMYKARQGKLWYIHPRCQDCVNDAKKTPEYELNEAELKEALLSRKPLLCVCGEGYNEYQRCPKCPDGGRLEEVPKVRFV